MKRFLRTIETPRGTLTEEAALDPSYGSRWITKYFITGPDDYPAAEYFLRHTRFEPSYQEWRSADQVIGAAGIVLAEIMPIPIMQAAVAWTGLEGFAEGLYHHRDCFEALVDAL